MKKATNNKEALKLIKNAKKGEVIIWDEREVINLKSDKEYKRIDRQERIQEKKSDKEFLKSAKEFNKKNKYWLKVFKIMPKEIQLQIIQGDSFFISTNIMLWLMTGDAKTRDIKLHLLKEWKKEIE